jgi:hypothetical protein
MLGSCGNDGESQTPINPGGGLGDEDFVRLSIGGAPEVLLTEASGLPSIDCDPRVDWASYQVVLWDDFTSGSGPNGYDLFFELMFPVNDDVGTYTVHGSSMQALLYDNGVNYSASPLIGASNGTVDVTRSDTRIEGTFTFTLTDATGTLSVAVSGSFGVEGGWSLSCP